RCLIMDDPAAHSPRLQIAPLGTMVEPGSIERSIRDGLPVTHLEVKGDGAHFEAVIVSPRFAGLNRVRQHQLVYAALGDPRAVHEDLFPRRVGRALKTTAPA